MFYYIKNTNKYNKYFIVLSIIFRLLYFELDYLVYWVSDIIINIIIFIT